uniref:HNH endonuclease n=1 Tax=Sciscionella sediminilitoris TaxID=1445613 RepID=UPI00055E1128
PPSLTQAHHIRHHANGGYTVENNMVLLCAYHHTLIHNTEWEVRIQHGKPEFTAPQYRQFSRTSTTPVGSLAWHRLPGR